MKALRVKKYTARELAAQFGCSLSTIHAHATKIFGAGKNGKRREFDEAQVTAILESIKTQQADNPTARTLQMDLEGTETPLTLDLQIALAEKAEKELAQKTRDLWKRKALAEKARADSAELELCKERTLRGARESGLEFYQRAAESAGLVLSDKDDLYSAYRGRRR
jgi:DNA-binding transcriptional MerR regulator